MARLGDIKGLFSLKSESEAGGEMVGLYCLREGILKRLRPWRNVESPPLFLLSPGLE